MRAHALPIDDALPIGHSIEPNSVEHARFRNAEAESGLTHDATKPGRKSRSDIRSTSIACLGHRFFTNRGDNSACGLVVTHTANKGDVVLITIETGVIR